MREEPIEQFTSRVVLVTGGATGIGLASVAEFARCGAKVMIAGRNASRLRAAVDESPKERVASVVTDVREPEQCRAAVRATIAKFGALDILVNCAGVVQAESILEISEATWNDTFATNLSGAFFTSQEAARWMLSQGRSGVIVNVASVDALVAESPQAHYNCSKAALVMLTKCFAYELGHHGIRCNAVAPGLTATAMAPTSTDTPGPYKDWINRIPLHRAATPAEQAKVIAFLASEDAAYVNGETLVSDGGALIGLR